MDAAHVFKNFPDNKNFPYSNATTLKGFLGLWVTCVGHACYAGHTVYENYKGLTGHRHSKSRRLKALRSCYIWEHLW